jgi:aminoglycoside 3-N-acetyltransferase
MVFPGLGGLDPGGLAIQKGRDLMSEELIVQATSEPRTRESLASDLAHLGVGPGMCLLVHSSLRALGWVAGGPVAVVQALTDVLTPSGTLVMPTHTSFNSEPSYWQNPAVPPSWWETIRTTMPAFDPLITPTSFMGQIVEVFRSWPGALRSSHPQVSFAALGPQARFITADHVLEDGLGEGSPLARIYDLDGWVLLLGVGHANNTSFHLGECRAGGVQHTRQGAAVREDGVRVWKTFSDLDWNAEPFAEVGSAFEAAEMVTVGAVGSAPARLFRQRPAVDFAKEWLASHQSGT